jgi:hypothetical protein
MAASAHIDSALDEAGSDLVVDCRIGMGNDFLPTGA